MSERTDIELVEAMAAGDQSSCALLYDRFSPSMYAVARKMLNNSQSAEDLVHDVFLEAWKRAGDYSPERGTVRTWLMLRLRSRAIDRLRSSGATRLISVEDTNLPEVPETPSEDLAYEPDRRAIRQAVKGLPPPQRLVLECAYFMGMSASEIAKQESIPIGTVKSRLAAALRRLRAGMQDLMWSQG